LNDAVASDGVNDAVGSGSISDAVVPGNAPELGLRNRIVGGPSEAPVSQVYQDLVARRQQQNVARPGQANEEASRQFNAARAARDKAALDKQSADQPNPAAQDKPAADGAKPNERKPADTADGDATDNKDTGKRAGGSPLKIGSLAGTAGHVGVDQMLSKAEDLMREGKFASAITTYDAAEGLSRGNPLIPLGRMHAELGGGFYRRAELTLRRTLGADKNLLAGQFDLKGVMGGDRLGTVETDLRELVTKNADDVGAAVLLAYVYYNTGNELRAAAMLDMADKRARGEDAFVKLLQQNWNVPKTNADNK